MTELPLNPASPTPIAPQATAAAAYAVQRQNMVDSQVRPSDITDRRILRAMAVVPRESFLPASLRAIAYMDNPIALDRTARGRVMIEPRLFAKLVQLAEIPDGGRVLEIGSGTGYGVAVLDAMGFKAFGVEQDQTLSAIAAAADPKLAAQISRGPLTLGLAAEGPYDAIIFAGSVADVPTALFDQLKNGARMVAVTGQPPAGKATVWLRTGVSHAARDAFDASAAALPGFARAHSFSL